MSPDLVGIALLVDELDTPCSSRSTRSAATSSWSRPALRHTGVTVTSAYVGAISGDTAVTHLRLSPRELHQRVLSGPQAGATHDAVACSITPPSCSSCSSRSHDAVPIVVSPAALQCAARAWQAAALTAPGAARP